MEEKKVEKKIGDSPELLEPPNIEKSLIEQAIEAAKQMREANAERKELLDREEKLKALDILGGRSPQSQPIQPHVETPREYADRILRGGK